MFVALIILIHLKKEQVGVVHKGFAICLILTFVGCRLPYLQLYKKHEQSAVVNRDWGLSVNTNTHLLILSAFAIEKKNVG